MVGVLRPSAKDAEPFVEPFRRYMKAIGWEEGVTSASYLLGWRATTSARRCWPAISSHRMLTVGTEVNIVQEGLPAAIPIEACYLGWQQSLNHLAMLVEPEIKD